MNELVSMPTKIVPYLRMTIEETGSKKEADFAVYHLGAEWGRETVRVSGEKSDMDELKTKLILTAVHSGITNLDVDVGETIVVEPYESKISDDYFLAGYAAGMVSELLGEYHVGKITQNHIEIERSERKIQSSLYRGQKETSKKVELKNLDRGESYIIPDDVKNAPVTFNTFFSSLEKDMPGLCFTRIFPPKIKEKVPEVDFPIFWLSTVDSTDEVHSIKPEEFKEDVIKIASAFLKMRQGIFMIHGIEFLISHSDFREILKVVQKIRDMNSLNQGIFLLSVDPKSIGKKEYNNLKSELNVYNV